MSRLREFPRVSEPVQSGPIKFGYVCTGYYVSEADCRRLETILKLAGDALSYQHQTLKQSLQELAEELQSVKSLRPQAIGSEGIDAALDWDSDEDAPPTTQ